MNPNIGKLIAYIISEVKSRESYVTKTKLLKLLYLFDVSYYRKHRKTFTGFDWVFLLLGPWTAEYDPLLEQLEAVGTINIQRTDRAEFYSTYERVDTGDFIESAADDIALRAVLNKWGEESTNRILDYVYFNTEPMINGVRYEPLDFSVITEERPPEYKRTASGKTRKELDAIRSQLLQNFSGAEKTQKAPSPIKYDAIFYEGMRSFEGAD